MRSKQLSLLDLPELKPKNQKLFSISRNQQLKYVLQGRPLKNWDKWNRWQFRVRQMYIPRRKDYIGWYKIFT